MNRRLLWVSSFLALAAACGGRSTGLAEDDSPVDTSGVNRIALRSSLPSCGKKTAGTAYYVVRDEQLVYCDGVSHQDVSMDSDSSWVFAAVTVSSCTYGGSRLSAGPDENGNGKLDAQEVVASATACNRAPSATPPADPLPTCAVHEEATLTGCSCVAGYVRASATSPCTALPATPAKPHGEDMPCSRDADCVGFEATFCDVYVTRSCLVPNCSLTPDSCSVGKECCDLASFGLPTLCIAAGACSN